MYLSNYKTDKQKRDHINRYWTREDLFNSLEAYLADPLCSEEEQEIFKDMKYNLKTKKAVLEKYLDVCWEVVCEEYSYA